MVSDQKLKFYLTPEHDCSYFKTRRATTLFADPRSEFNTHRFANLTENGFRRSGDYIYRPHCSNCQACESLRVPVNTFKISQSQKRILKKNADLTVSISKPVFREEHFKLYQRYIDIRHQDGDMYPATEQQYRSFLLAEIETARLIEFRHKKSAELLAISIIDQFPNALSAIYTFFEPDQNARSLGGFAILWQLAYCQKESLAYLYLGYYIKDSHKMSYKNKFRPYQIYQNEQWVDCP